MVILIRPRERKLEKRMEHAQMHFRRRGDIPVQYFFNLLSQKNVQDTFIADSHRTVFTVWLQDHSLQQNLCMHYVSHEKTEKDSPQQKGPLAVQIIDTLFFTNLMTKRNNCLHPESGIHTSLVNWPTYFFPLFLLLINHFYSLNYNANVCYRVSFNICTYLSTLGLS